MVDTKTYEEIFRLLNQHIISECPRLDEGDIQWYKDVDHIEDNSTYIWKCHDPVADKSHLLTLHYCKESPDHSWVSSSSLNGNIFDKQQR